MATVPDYSFLFTIHLFSLDGDYRLFTTFYAIRLVFTVDHGQNSEEESGPAKPAHHAKKASGILLCLRQSQSFPDVFHGQRIENANTTNVELLLAIVKSCSSSNFFDSQCLETF